MRNRNVVRLVVVAAVSLVILYAPTKDQSAYACPYAREIKVEYWRVPVCEASPPVCEQVEPQLLGTDHFTCDGNWTCSGDCDGTHANEIIIKYGRNCPACPPLDP